MNIKLQISEVVRLINNRIPMELIYKQLTPLAEQAKIGFPAPQTGAGYLQWTLQGNGWIAFSKANAEQKATVSQLYHERSKTILATLKDSPLKDIIFTVPSEDFIYFRENGYDYEISLIAWGYKYPNHLPCTELSTWINKSILQKVYIGFKWDGKLLTNYNFSLANLKRKTSDDGLFYVDGALPVGKEYQIKANSNIPLTLKVEQGKEDYIFDLTQYVYIDITVLKDNIAMANCICEIKFNGIQHQLETNETGCASLKLPLVCNVMGELLQPQPTCQAKCQNETQEQIPFSNVERMKFNFSFHSKANHPLKPESPEPSIPLIPPTPSVVKQNLKFVEIKLLDYSGSPMADLNFTLVTKRKGSVKLKTDANGICNIPQEWFTKKEKFQVKVEISPEYQEMHDLHDTKNTKK